MPRSNFVQPDIFHPDNRSVEETQPVTGANTDLNGDSDRSDLSEPDEDDDLLGDEELLSDGHIDTALNRFTHELTEDRPDATELDDWLDESSLNTVLDILTTIATVEELAILEALSAAQKRQVWSQTPETIKIKLKQIRQADAASAVTLNGWQTLQSSHDRNHPPLQVGDWVVLLPKPKLTKAELVAIWEVVEIHEASARINSQHLSPRTYPINWMMPYPKPIST